MKTVYVTIKVELRDDVDVEEFFSEMDYDINYAGVVDTEAVRVDTKQLTYVPS